MFTSGTFVFLDKLSFDKSWGLWPIVLRLRDLHGLCHTHGLNPFTSFSHAFAGIQLFENSALPFIGCAHTRTTNTPWRKQFPSTHAKLHFTKQWNYAVGCCWFWTYGQHRLQEFGVALRSQLQPGAQFVSLSCQFFVTFTSEFSNVVATCI